jgi:hypothetical protein
VVGVGDLAVWLAGWRQNGRRTGLHTTAIAQYYPLKETMSYDLDKSEVRLTISSLAFQGHLVVLFLTMPMFTAKRRSDRSTRLLSLLLLLLLLSSACLV